MYWGRRERFEQSVDRASMHEVGAYETSEVERAMDDVLGLLSHAQDEKGDQRDSDLNAHGVFGCANEALDSQYLLDPAKEQLDFPALPVEIGDLLGRRIEVVGDDTQHLAGFDAYAKLADGDLHRVLAAAGEP